MILITKKITTPRALLIVETALNVAIKRMVEHSKMTEASKDNADEASVLLQEHHKRNCNKAHIMMSDDHNQMMTPACNVDSLSA